MPTLEEVKPHQPQPQPPKPPKWVSIEEAEKLERYIGKQYVPKDDEKFAKKFYYRVESFYPYSLVNQGGGADQSLYKLVLQKYHRNKTEKANVADDKGNRVEVERNARVEQHILSEKGNWIRVDALANIPVDLSDFKEQYVPDTVID